MRLAEIDLTFYLSVSQLCPLFDQSFHFGEPATNAPLPSRRNTKTLCAIGHLSSHDILFIDLTQSANYQHIRIFRHP